MTITRLPAAVRVALLTALGASLLAAAPIATPDGDLSLACLKMHQPIENGDSVAVSLKDGAKSWGVCLTLIKRDRSKSWWVKRGKDWTVLGPPTNANATLTAPPSKHFGVPAADVSILTAAFLKAVANVKHDPSS